MLINLYQALKGYPSFSKQLNCKGMLFTNYECPQPTGKQQFFIECNYIAYVISGKRIFQKNKKSLPLVNLPLPSPEHVIELDVNDLSKSFFLSMLPYFSQTPPPPEHLLELKFKELVLSLLSNKKNDPFLSYLNQLSQDKHLSLEEVMLNNYTFNLTLQEYAKLACKSIPTFQRDFKRMFKDTPAKWVMKKRLALARELLENTSDSIAEIAFECGFENQTHFSRVFKEKVGKAPLQYRMSLQTL